MVNHMEEQRLFLVTASSGSYSDKCDYNLFLVRNEKLAEEIVEAFTKVIPEFRDAQMEFCRNWQLENPLPVMPERKRNGDFVGGKPVWDKYQECYHQWSTKYTEATNKFNDEKVAEFVQEFPENVREKIAPHLLDFNDYYSYQEISIID